MELDPYFFPPEKFQMVQMVPNLKKKKLSEGRGSHKYIDYQLIYSSTQNLPADSGNPISCCAEGERGQGSWAGGEPGSTLAL